MEKADPHCVICGSLQRSPLYTHDQWQVYKCDHCGLGVLDLRPGIEELAALYAQQYFQNHYDAPLTLNSPEMERRLKQEKHRLRFFHKFKPSGKCLDIGSGRGYFLLACRKAGYGVEGIDISQSAAAYVTEELNIPVHVGNIDDISLSHGSFDVITMWHSLEHTIDPNLYLQYAGKWLKADGILVIDVPDYAGHDAQMNWQNWPHWDLPYHFYHFTKNSLLALLKKHGFEIIREKDYLSEYVKEKLENAGVPRFVSRIIARFYSGGSYAVVARKV
jgi:SAM-dependent methyltransferase